MLSRYDNPVIHEIIPVGPLQCNCSIVGDEASREAMVIDPGDAIEEIMARVERHGQIGRASCRERVYVLV